MLTRLASVSSRGWFRFSQQTNTGPLVDIGGFCDSRSLVFSDSWQPAKMWGNESDWSTRLASIENQDHSWFCSYGWTGLIVQFNCTSRVLPPSSEMFFVGSLPDGYTAMSTNQTHGGKSPVLSAAVCSHTLIQVCCFLSADCFSLLLLFSFFFFPSLQQNIQTLWPHVAHAVSLTTCTTWTSTSTLLEVQLNLKDTELYIYIFCLFLLSFYLEHITHMNHCLPLEVMSRCLMLYTRVTFPLFFLRQCLYFCCVLNATIASFSSAFYLPFLLLSNFPVLFFCNNNSQHCTLLME